jgi:transposase
MGYVERSSDLRKTYLKKWYKYFIAGKTFVYIDETGFSSSVVRPYGYALRGTRVYGLKQGKREKRTSLIAARIGNQALQAPMLFEKTCTARVVNAWLEQQLLPLLQENMVVVMDNAPFHKSVKTRELIENTGATLLFLPPYSPDLNPIEHDFANLKNFRAVNENTPLDQLIKMYN